MTEEEISNERANAMMAELNKNLSALVRDFAVKCSTQYRLTNHLEAIVFNNLPENEQRHWFQVAKQVIELNVKALKIG